MPHRKEIGRTIKEYFSEIGMSQLDAANALGVQQAAVSNQLNGRPFGKIRQPDGTRPLDSG